MKPSIHESKILLKSFRSVLLRRLCVKFTPAFQKKNFTKFVKVAYKHYIVCKIGDQDKAWVPHICFKNGYTGLTQWLNGKQKSMPFAVPIIWLELINHAND